MTTTNTSSGAVAQPLGDRELDALREVANIGAGHAATALSTLLRTSVMISVPRVSVIPLKDVPPVVSSEEEPVVAVLLNLLGDLTGRTLLMFPADVAHRLATQLLQREPRAAAPLDELETSAINEVANILSSAYMSALGDFLGMVVLPTPPTLSVNTSTAVLMAAHQQAVGSRSEAVICVESELLLSEIGERVRGFFLLLPDDASLVAMLRALRAM